MLSVYHKLLDPETLIDYNPVDGGIKIGVAGLAGLTAGEACLYGIKAQIGNKTFSWEYNPDWHKTFDGQYRL